MTDTLGTELYDLIAILLGLTGMGVAFLAIRRSRK